MVEIEDEKTPLPELVQKSEMSYKDFSRWRKYSQIMSCRAIDSSRVLISDAGLFLRAFGVTCFM